MVNYKMVLDIRRSKGGLQKCCIREKMTVNGNFVATALKQAGATYGSFSSFVIGVNNVNSVDLAPCGVSITKASRLMELHRTAMMHPVHCHRPLLTLTYLSHSVLSVYLALFFEDHPQLGQTLGAGLGVTVGCAYDW